MLTLYNTLTRTKEAFQPLKPGVVSVYVCGITVYDYCHIGHGRSMVTFDILSRYLRYLGLEVNFVRNVTDIDDKIIARALERGVDYTEITAEFILALNEDMQALGLLIPNHQPRATEYVPQMIEMIERLEERGYAYALPNGDVCFRVRAFEAYGELAHRDLEKLQAGARIEVEVGKEDPLDFVLWKKAKAGEPAWRSPWGEGRPGWHIECSVMSTHCLGETFDIHGGGADLQFPHHENEIAQARCAYPDSQFARFWMHSGLVRINAEKMSKSLGNFFTIREVLEKYDAEVVRYFMLSSHYRSPVDYSDQALDNARAAIERFYMALRGLELPDNIETIDDEYSQAFQAAMNDDLNTPQALAVLFDLVREINRFKDEGDMAQAAVKGARLRDLAAVLGLLHQQPEDFLQGGQSIDAAEIERLIEERNAARANKDWVLSDAIRDKLHGLGVAIEDNKDGTSWRLLD